MKKVYAILSVLLISGCLSMPVETGENVKIEGRISAGVYQSPGGAFAVGVPVMRNPFVKKPTLIRDESGSDGAEGVYFGVPDLGEAYRFGVVSLDSAAGHSLSDMRKIVATVLNHELTRWLKQHQAQQPDGSNTAPDIVLEESILLDSMPGLARIYYVDAASLLFMQQGDREPVREPALIGIIAASIPVKKRVLFAVGQFDMGNKSGPFTLDHAKWRQEVAGEHLARMKEMTVSLQAL